MTVTLERRVALKHELFGAWCAPIFTVLTVIGYLGLAHWWHPAPGHLSAAGTAAWFSAHHLGVEWGMSIFGLASAFLAVYSIELTLVLWRREGTPLFALGQLLGGFAVVMLIFISCCLWIGAAYRAGRATPDVTVALNDASWFGFLVGWVMLSLQMLCAAVITLRDRGPNRLAPRWVGWASVAGAIALVTANGCVFAKSGPFNFNGVLGYYIPMTIWGLWLDGHAWLVRKDVRRRIAEAETAPGLASLPELALERQAAHA